MEKLYCEYCGILLSEKCNCLREIAEAEEQFIEDYENNPITQAGWAFEDKLYNSHFYQR